MHSVQQYADKTGIHPKKVQRLAKEGKIKAKKIGKTWIITEPLKKKENE